MGKLAVRLCIGGGAVAALVQIVALFMPYYKVMSASPVMMLLGHPMIKYEVTLTELHIESQKFIGLQDIGRVWEKNTPERQLRLAKEKAEKEEAELKKLGKDEREKKEAEIEKNNAALERVRAEYKKQFNEDWKEYMCNGGRSKCITIKLYNLASLFSNSAIMMGQALLPQFPGSHNTGFVLYYGGMAVLILSIIMILVQVLGCGYLYYYAEVKATKTARKGALVTYVAAPVLAMLVFLIVVSVNIYISQAQQQWFWAFFNAQGGYFPGWGFWMVFFNMVFLWILVIFSRFWRMKRAERVRKQKKDEEEEEEFMRLMGIDPSAAMEEDSDDELSAESEEESDDEESQPTQSGYGYAQPQVVYSAPAYGVQPQVVSYGAAQPQVVQVQPNVQRVYL